MMINTIIISILLVLARSDLGVDLSTLTSTEAFKCLLSNNYTFLNVRAWRSFGSFDPNSVQTLVNAKAAGYKVENLGVYMFPCYNVEKTAAAQMKEMVSQLSNSEYSTIWIDMETNLSPNCGWTSNYDSNCLFTEELVN